MQDAPASLSLNAVHVEGEVPESGAPPPVGAGAHAPGGGGGLAGGLELETLTVSGVDVRKPGLAMVTPDQVAQGRYLSARPRRARGAAVVDLGYARQKGVAVGDEVKLAGSRFDIVGLAGAPLGGDASNVYVELGRLQELSDREGRANEIRVRADSADAVGGLASNITGAAGGLRAGIVIFTAWSTDAAHEAFGHGLGPHLDAVGMGDARPLAALISVARVAMGTHYPSDVLGGAVLGGLAALVIWLPPIRGRLHGLADRLGQLYERLIPPPRRQSSPYES